MGEQMTHFGNGERKQRTGRRFLIVGRLIGRYPGHCADACKAGLNDHDECHVYVIRNRSGAHIPNNMHYSD